MMPITEHAAVGNRGRRFARRVLGPALGAFLAVGAFSTEASAQTSLGTWVKAPANPATHGPAFGLWMLTDGRVLTHGSSLNNWEILTPDAKGSYANGTWKAAANSNYARGGAQEHMLNDGRFFEAGGEYIYTCPTGVANCASQYNTVEIYDPVANTWTLQAPGLFGDIGDTGSATLANGTILESNRNSSQMQIYDPKTNTWTKKNNSKLGTGDENAWAELQNGAILAVGYAGAGAAVYNPATDTWTKTTTPSGFNTGDTGGISMAFDGRVFVYGLAGKSYIYTPGATAADVGSWAVGPAMLNGDEAEDEYCDTLPNGLVVGALVGVTYGPGLVWQAWDPTSNTVYSATPPPDTGNPYPISYVNLPNGQVMVEAEQADADWILTLTNGPQDAWRPVVQSVAFNGGNSYTLTGTQITGLINGADEGDDMTMQQNYPIVWLKDPATGNVYYCRTFNISQMTPSKGSALETTDFTTPAGLPAGTYDLYVSAVGVPSKDPVVFTVGQNATGPDAGASSSSSSSSSTGSSSGASSSGASSSGASTSGASSSGGTTGDDAGATATTSSGSSSSAGTASSGSTASSSGSAASSSSASSGESSGASGASSGGATASSGASSGGATGGSASSSGATGKEEPIGNQPGCGCVTAGERSTSWGWLLAVAGLAAAGLRRRPNRKA
jgi:MYXO-CTERM domain-containing protein